MRQIILDTETTGLEPELGHRIVEIGGVELVNRRLTGNDFHRHVNPERESDAAALEVHGLTADFLSDKPKFQDIAAELLDYLAGAEVIIHNAAFDVAFLNHELGRCNHRPITECCASVVDSLRLARDLHPGKRNNLDALCERYQVDNAARTLHSALLDARLLAEVYLCMTRGQETLMMEVDTTATAVAAFEAALGTLDLVVIRASAEELAEHARVLDEIGRVSKSPSLWRKLEA
jgi:DNA polymerase-3 subunit epsilon